MARLHTRLIAFAWLACVLGGPGFAWAEYPERPIRRWRASCARRRGSTEDFAALIVREIAQWRELAKAANIKLD